jgi:hypothetical protein
MNTPLAGWPSTNSVAPFGYDAEEVIADKVFPDASGRLQDSRSSRCGHAKQFSNWLKAIFARSKLRVRLSLSG